jgi:hypothetical protein
MRNSNRRFTTWRYEPPEATQKNDPWPRRYDVWSIGCIILEFIVWMVHGSEELNAFNDRIINEFGTKIHYFEPVMKSGRSSFQVHKAVSSMIVKLAQHPACEAGQTALGDLLEIVRTKLIVVELGDKAPGQGRAPQISANTQTPSRAHSETLEKDLGNIIELGNRYPSYWLKGETSDDPPTVSALQVARPGLEPPKTLTVNSKRSSRSIGDTLTTDSSYLLVPKLTGSMAVGSTPRLLP